MSFATFFGDAHDEKSVLRMKPCCGFSAGFLIALTSAGGGRSPTDGSIQVDRYFDTADNLNSVDEYGFAYVFLFTDCKTKALTVTELPEEKARAVAHRSSGRLRRI